MAQMLMVEALNLALKQEMKRDPAVMLMGEDVGVNGGVFRVSDKLIDIYGFRADYFPCRAHAMEVQGEIHLPDGHTRAVLRRRKSPGTSFRIDGSYLRTYPGIEGCNPRNSLRRKRTFDFCNTRPRS